MFQDLPYRVEYAKSGRATCHSCEQPIDASSLRLAIITHVPSMDERTKNWFHFDCFFGRARPTGPEAIDAFEYLKFEDQSRILHSLGEIKKEKHSKQALKRIVELEDPNELVEIISPKRAKSDTNRLNELNSDLTKISRGQYDSINPTESKSPIKSAAKTPNLTEKERDLLQHQSNLLFRNIEETERMGSFKKFPSDHWIQKIRSISTDAFQVRYHIADQLTFGFLDACATCGGMLYYKLGRYCCAVSTCAFNVESPERHFSDEQTLEKDQLLDGYHFERCHETRVCDPVLRQCFELRVKQALDFVDSNDSETESKIEPFENDKPVPNFFIRDCHILEPYNAVLVKVNILDNKNSYTRIQLLEDAEKKKLWLVRAYGRIGTTFRGRRVKYFVNQSEAIAKFVSVYESQTKQHWTQRQHSSQQPNSYFHLHLDCVNPDDVGICLPFGKPTKEQLVKAHLALVEIEHVSPVTFDNLVQFAQLWNKFYSYFPQCFGSERPALITNCEKIAQKKNIIEQLIRV